MVSATYWPFWAGGLALAAITVGHLLWTGRPLAVSGGLARLLRFRAEERERHAEAALATGELDAALLAATRARFGETAEAECANGRGAVEAPSVEASSPASRERLPIDCVALFFMGLVLGGALARHLSAPGTPLPDEARLGSLFGALADSSAASPWTLAFGGLLVGFGARMAGGCTSGHGLSGLASLQPASALATAAMFVGGIALSFGLGPR